MMKMSATLALFTLSIFCTILLLEVQGIAVLQLNSDGNLDEDIQVYHEEHHRQLKCFMDEEKCDCDSDCCSGVCRFSVEDDGKVCRDREYALAEILDEVKTF